MHPLRTHAVRTHELLHKFLNWWQSAPWLLTIWFTPLVIVLWLAAIVKNFFSKGHNSK